LPRAPRILRALGLEWLFRLFIQPKERAPRIFNAILNFPLHCFLWRWQTLFKYQKESFAVILNETGKIFIARDKKTGKWLLPTANNNAAAFIENTDIDENRLIQIKNEYIATTVKHPKIIKLLTGRKGARRSLTIMKFVGSSQTLQLPPEGEWNDYKWVSREVLINELPQHFSDLAEQISKTL